MSLNLNLNCFIPTSYSGAWIQLRWHKFLVSIISHHQDQGWLELVFPRVFSKFAIQFIEISHKLAWLCTFRAIFHICLRRHNKHGVVPWKYSWFMIVGLRHENANNKHASFHVELQLLVIAFVCESSGYYSFAHNSNISINVISREHANSFQANLFPTLKISI